jgi:hypothetical protein
MAEPTTARLARALAEIPGVPRDMIARAIDGYYDDYLSPLALPILTLWSDLRALADLPKTPAASRPLLRALADRVRNGDFDGTREEAESWRRSEEGQAVFRELLGEEPGRG